VLKIRNKIKRREYGSAYKSSDWKDLLSVVDGIIESKKEA